MPHRPKKKEDSNSRHKAAKKLYRKPEIAWEEELEPAVALACSKVAFTGVPCDNNPGS